MKVLVACEYSGTVRNAFGHRGHYAVSCDILAGELYLFNSSSGRHYQGSVMDILGDGWDLLIAHPPCTFLSYAGNKYWNDPGRLERRIQAMEFFEKLLYADIPKICIENPLGLPCKKYPDYQIINPFLFGEPYRKRTCLWLRGLPRLIPTKIVVPRVFKDGKGHNRPCTDVMSVGTGDVRRKQRSKFFEGVAVAMAEQWGKLET